MGEGEFRKRRVAVLLVVATLALSLGPGVAAAQQGVGGTVVVESGETVSSVEGVYGTIVVRGTVTGDVSAAAGNVVVDGTVEGDLDVAAGNVVVRGTVEGDVSTGAGTLRIAESGTVGGDVDAGAGDVRIDGTIGGDARIGADTIRLGDTATIEGSLTYDGTLEGNRDAVAGEITEDPSIGTGLVSEVQPFARWIFAINAFVLNLLLGVLLLGLFPRFSDGVAERVAAQPVRAGAVGLAIVLLVPLALFLLALTVIGLPITFVGLLVFALVAWVGLVYGRFAVGAWLLSFAGVGNRWAALLLGLVIGAVVWQLPIVGGPLNIVIALLGLGALSIGLFDRQRGGRTPTSTTAPGESTESTTD